jgi:hypothetical protein
MAVVKVVEVVSPVSAVGETSNKAVVVEVVKTTNVPINTTSGAAVVQVASRPVVENAVVSPTAPPFPYENMIWIEVP